MLIKLRKKAAFYSIGLILRSISRRLLPRLFFYMGKRTPSFLVIIQKNYTNYSKAEKSGSVFQMEATTIDVVLNS